MIPMYGRYGEVLLYIQNLWAEEPSAKIIEAARKLDEEGF
jgi:hypothetical protein